MRVIGLTGRIGSGKSTAANHLINVHGFTLVKFAGPLKNMMRALGLTEREIEGDLKELPCDLLAGKTPRFAMQQLGTEFGRQMIAEDIWIRAWRAACERLPTGASVVADDVRYQNEADAVRAMGGTVVRLERDTGQVGSHASEALAFDADLTLRNDSTVAALLASVDRLIGDFIAKDRLT